MIGLIGGTGISKILSSGKEEIIHTKYGKSKVLIDKENDVALLFRHGANHNTPPHKINYKANIAALKKLGVCCILATNAVGSLKEQYAPGSFFVPNDFMEFTKQRESTYYNGENGEVVHIDVSNPFCPNLSNTIKEILNKRNYSYGEGTIICTEGPRFETKSEIKFYKTIGDVVGMTTYPEVVLARELQLCYSSICTITNYCTGISKKELTVSEVYETINEIEEKIITIVEDFINYNLNNCNYCKSILESAKM